MNKKHNTIFKTLEFFHHNNIMIHFLKKAFGVIVIPFCIIVILIFVIQGFFFKLKGANIK